MELVPLQTDLLSAGSDYLSKIKEMAFLYAPKLLGAILVYLIGSFLIKWVSKMLDKVLKSREFDVSLQSFLGSFVKVILSLLLLLTVFGMLGVNLTSIAAILAGLAFGVGAALNGTLGNFAGGVMMLLFKPFKVGDLIAAQDQLGTVLELGVFHTTLLTPDNKTAILANGPLSTGTIVNYTTSGFLRVDTEISIYSNVDIAKARKIAEDALMSIPEVKKDPAPLVKVKKVADGTITLAIMPFCDEKDYWTVYFGTQETVKNAFAANGIEVPIPHRVIVNK